jgi:uncharacterized membrane protein YqjE
MSETNKRSLSSMLSSLIEDIPALLRGHIELAKAEFKEGVVNFFKASLFLLFALATGHLALIFVLVTAGFALVALGLQPWAAFLIVTGVLVLVTGYFVWAGIRKFRRVTQSRKTMDALTETADAVKSRLDEK